MMQKIKRYKLKDRESKVDVSAFAKVVSDKATVEELFYSLPAILGGAAFKATVEATALAYKRGKPVILGMGTHLIKCGLSPIIIDLMKIGVINGINCVGAACIHDFEIALAGKTSEDTAKYLSEAIKEGAEKKIGIGAAVGKKILALGVNFLSYSIFANAVKYDIPILVHVALGTDIIHMHPEIDGKSIGEASLLDFNKFVNLVESLNDGGVYLHFGSPVILPEVFLKAVSIVRNRGNLTNFVVANFDMYPSYRPTMNIILRPTSGGMGEGYNILGHHELTLPLFAASLKNII